MADENPAPEAEIDVDTLDDTQFAKLKGKMRAEPAPEPEKKPEKPEKAAAPEPELPPGDDDDEPEVDANGKKRETVPHGQWHRERERRKAAEAERERVQGDYSKLLQRTTELLQVQQPQQEPEAPPAVPEWGADPMAAGSWTQKEMIALKQRLDAEDNARAQAAAENQLLDRVNASLNQAITADHTVKDAHDALRRSVGAELLAIGWTQADVATQVNEIERQHARFVVENNIPIGDYLKRLAGARGWAPKAPEPAPVNEAEKIAKREELRLASLSLGKGGGAVVNTGDLSPEELLDMSDDEFDAYKKKHGSVAHAFRRASA